MKHTPEPWETSVNEDEEWDICEAGGGDMIADLRGCPNAKVNAHRIIACVNACASINPEAVPHLYGALKKIMEAKGPYSRDRLEHCSNTVKAMVEIAEKALVQADSDT